VAGTLPPCHPATPLAFNAPLHSVALTGL
jgi:hypothetical protein